MMMEANTFIAHTIEVQISPVQSSQVIRSIFTGSRPEAVPDFAIHCLLRKRREDRLTAFRLLSVLFVL